MNAPQPERFSASVAGRHMACHASANLGLAIPHWVPPVEDPTADNAANRGSRAHEILAEIVGGGLREVKNFQRALGYVEQLMERRRFKRLIEEEATAWWLNAKPKTSVDLVLHTRDEMHIIDWKWGKIPVDVHDNAQLMYYAAAFSYLSPKATGVTVHIVQPAADNMASAFLSAEDIRDFMTESTKAEIEIQAGDTTFTPGDHCTFCAANPRGRGEKGRPLCPALMEMYYPEVLDENAILGE